MMRPLRRGSALILVLIMTLALAGLAMSAVYMTSSSGLLSRFHDKDRDLAFAVETALELGKSRLQRDNTLVLYDTGFKQLLTSQPVYTSGGALLTGVTVNLYAGNTGDTSGVYVPYVTLLATVSDASGLRLARRMDLYQRSFSSYSLFADDFPSSASIGAGENLPGRVHTNNRFIAASAGSPYPVFNDTVSSAGTISGFGQWADTVSATGGARAIPYPTAAELQPGFQTRAGSASLSLSLPGGSAGTRATSGAVDVSGAATATAMPGSRLEFLTIDVNSNGVADSTEGFFKVFHLYPSSYFMGSGYYWVGGGDTTRLSVNFTGTPISLNSQVMLNQCGAFYLIPKSGGGYQREFFPVVMHKVSWVRSRIQTSAYPSIGGGEASTMAALDRTAIRHIAQLPTARCFPQGSPYLVNTERFTINSGCAQDWFTIPATRYTWGSSSACASAGRQYGGQDTTFTQYSFTCPVDQSDAAGRCTGDTVYMGYWDTYSGGNNLPGTLPASVRQNVERQHLFPLHRTYNPGSRGVVYVNGRIFLSGTVRGRATVYVNGVATLQDDVRYDSDPADTTNLCRNNFGLIAKDSIMVSDNVINRPRVYDTPSTTAGYTLTLGGNREFGFEGTVMALGGSFNTFNPNVATATNPVYTCPEGSSFTAAGGCLHVTGGTVMKTYASPYTATANSGLRPLRELDPCQLQNRRPPYFPLARTVVRPVKAFDVDARQVKTTALLTAYFTRLRGVKAAP